MDAITLLEQDHRAVEALFKKFEDSEDPVVQVETAALICKMLQVHTSIEEELFYPKARKVLAKEDDDDLVDEAVHEHAMAKELIEKIQTMKAGLLLTGAIKMLKMAIEHHVKEEETEMFPELKQLGMETVQLGTQLETRKTQLMSA